MKCPACGADFEPSAATTPTAGERAIKLFTDWRVWAVACAASIVGALVAAALHLPAAGGGAAAAIGVYVAIRLGRIGKCPRCNKPIYVDARS